MTHLRMTRYRSLQLLIACAVGGLLAHGAVQRFQRAPIAPAPPDTPAAAEPEARSAEPSRARTQADAILSRTLFPVVTPEPLPVADSAHPGVRVEGGLNLARKLSLIGTVQREHGSGVAIVEDLTSKKQGLFRLRDRVFQLGELADIQPDRVLIREGRQEEWLASASPTLNAPARTAALPQPQEAR